ncbi:unnamed protein product [Fusarium graminearum]|nr:unnamed protein product [Fusarium graminearum]
MKLVVKNREHVDKVWASIPGYKASRGSNALTYTFVVGLCNTQRESIALSSRNPQTVVKDS